MEDFLLTDEEFDALSPKDQAAYLDLLATEVDTWKLTPRQAEADRLADRCDETLYGGAAGGGKSIWLLHRANRLSIQIPGHHTLLLRSAIPELRRSLIRESINLFAGIPADVRPTWRASVKEWRYPNGSIIEFGSCNADEDVGQYLSAEYDLIGFDELTEFPSQYAYDMIRSRARTKRRKKELGARPHIIAATNPGRKGHSWVKELFVTGTHHGQIINEIVTKLDTGHETIRRVGFVHATVLDNPHIDPKYVEHLTSLPEMLRRQYLDGDWDIFEGQFFPEFARSKTLTDGTVVPWHVVEPFPIPHEWPRWRAVDYGTYHPFVCLWITMDHDGTAYIYREAVEKNLTATEQAQLINRLSVCETGGTTKPEKFDFTIGDPTMRAERSSQSPAMMYAKEGIHIRPGNNDRVGGWNRVREWLRADTENGPALRIFSTCTYTINTLPELVHDPHKPEDVYTRGDDHAADALRYWCMERPRVPRKPVSPEDNSIEARIRRRIEKISNTRRGRTHPVLGRI